MTAREKIDKHEFLESSNNAYSLRGHEYKIAVQRSRAVVRSAFFSQRVLTSWNKLPEEVVNATSINMFKNRLERCNIRLYQARLHQVSSIKQVNFLPVEATKLCMMKLAL